MVAATAVDVAASGGIPASNLQVFIDNLVGQVEYAASAAGAAAGSAEYANQLAGYLNYHQGQMASLLSYTRPAFVYVPTPP